MIRSTLLIFKLTFCNLTRFDFLQTDHRLTYSQIANSSGCLVAVSFVRKLNWQFFYSRIFWHSNLQRLYLYPGASVLLLAENLLFSRIQQKKVRNNLSGKKSGKLYATDITLVSTKKNMNHSLTCIWYRIVSCQFFQHTLQASSIQPEVQV